MTTKAIQTILIPKINNQNASNWLVRDFSSCYNCYLVLGPKEFPIALKKIGSYIGKLKNTFSSFQREISSVTNEIDIENNITQDQNSEKKDKKDD